MRRQSLAMAESQRATEAYCGAAGGGGRQGCGTRPRPLARSPSRRLWCTASAGGGGVGRREDGERASHPRARDRREGRASADWAQPPSGKVMLVHRA
ncbi:hypothetical protein NN561_009239 [Cricetulus griseus]